jgi:hypothetical protein
MATIDHSVLAGTELHEPKGVDSADLGQVYVADGNGSGNWASIGTSSFTGMIADFTWPVVQDGWLELDGSDISTSTYGGLYDVMTIQMTGTRVSGSAIITSLSSTSNMRAGYYVFGTGIASGTTVLSIDSGTQITLSANASSSGSSTVVVSPWLLNTGTIRLPNLSAAGRYRRSRTASTRVGQLQDSTNLAHTHTGSGTTSNVSNDHTHTFSGNTGAMSANSTHSHSGSTVSYRFASAGAADYNGLSQGDTGTYTTLGATGVTDTNHVHGYSGTTSGISTNHTHTYSHTTSSQGDTESRPTTIVVMTCVKT